MIFIEYDPKVSIKVKGVCIGFLIKSQLMSDRVPGEGPDLPPNTLDVTDRESEAEGINLGAGGWSDFTYDPKTDKFTRFDIEKDWPEGLEGNGSNP